ncbi:hypothetical protein Vretimale_19536, partial [Volvox reticuliferus]
RHDVEGGSASAAQITVRGIQQALVTSVRVGGGHGALHDAELLLEDLDEWGQAVGRARGVRDDRVLMLVVRLVNTNDEGRDVLVLSGRGDQHLLGTSLQMLASANLVNEDTSALNDQVDVQLAPWKRQRVAARHDLND